MINWKIVPSGSMLDNGKLFVKYEEINNKLIVNNVEEGKLEYVEVFSKEALLSPSEFKLEYLLPGTILKINNVEQVYLGMTEDKLFFTFIRSNVYTNVSYTKSVKEFSYKLLTFKEDDYSPNPLIRRKMTSKQRVNNYYYISILNKIISVQDDESRFDNLMFAYGNYFESYEKAWGYINRNKNKEPKKYEHFCMSKEEKDVIITCLLKEKCNKQKDVEYLNTLMNVKQPNNTNNHTVNNIIRKIDIECNNYINYIEKIDQIVNKLKLDKDNS